MITVARQKSVFGQVQLISPPSGEVVTLAKAKSHCRIPKDSHEEDEDMRGWIATATEMCEKQISGFRQFLTATYAVSVSEWWCGRINVPYPPLQHVELFYYDADAAQQTLAPATYIVETPMRQPGTIELAPNQEWPTVEDGRSSPIQLRFRCGYGGPADVPWTAKQAILMTVQLLYKRCLDSEALESIRSYLETNLGYGSYA